MSRPIVGRRGAFLRITFRWCPFFDIQIHPRENDLILATHGRGIWICDDITALEKTNEAALSPTYLAPPRPTVLYRQTNLSGASGHKHYFGTNPSVGARFDYYLTTAPKSGCY